jgi:hydroxymethylpyrimidine/phosphomethylpyrimidine kinase
VLTIAGSDCSGGAGIQADIKAISATGCYAASVITALTAQNTQGVQQIYELSPEFVAQQLDSVFSDLTINAVKIGMLHQEKIIDKIAQSLQQWRPDQVVLDPVMIAKSGCSLISATAIQALQYQLFPQVDLITPNLPEASALIGQVIKTRDDMQAAAIKLGEQFKFNVLVKGGHATEKLCADVLYIFDKNECHWFEMDRINTNNTHGTGCTLSSAIASYLAQGKPLVTAVEQAKKYLHAAISAGSDYELGLGHGPVHHFFSFW